MKRIALILFLCVISFNLNAQENYPKLQEVKNLAVIDGINFDSPVDKNLEKFNSENLLNSDSDISNKKDTKPYTPKKFSFSINPYAWFTAVGGTVGYYNGEKFGFNKSFTDAVKNLKMAASVAGKIKYERVSLIYDISYFNLKGFGTEVPDNRVNIRSANWTAKQALYDLFLSYILPAKNKSAMVNLYVGTRLWDLETEVTVIDTNGTQSPNKIASNSWLDPVIGVNSDFLFSNQWFAYAKGDIGGFGVNSQMTWQLAAGAGYLLSPNFPMTLGFKYVGVNYDKNALDWTVNEYGFTLSIGYRY